MLAEILLQVGIDCTLFMTSQILVRRPIWYSFLCPTVRSWSGRDAWFFFYSEGSNMALIPSGGNFFKVFFLKCLV